MPFFAKCDIDTAGEMREMIGDKEHLQHEFNSMFSKEDIRKISRQEMAAAWFSSHDTDGDNHLDGTEVYKAVQHSRGHATSGGHHTDKDDGRDGEESADADPNRRRHPGVPSGIKTPADWVVESDRLGTEDRSAIAFVDQLLMRFDTDNDGRLDYTEYARSFQES